MADEQIVPRIPTWVLVGVGGGVLLLLVASSRQGESPVGSEAATAPVVATITAEGERTREEIDRRLTQFEEEMRRRLEEDRRIWAVNQQVLEANQRYTSGLSTQLRGAPTWP